MIKNKTDLIRVDYHLQQQQIDRLKEIKDLKGISVAVQIRIAVDAYLKQQI